MDEIQGNGLTEQVGHLLAILAHEVRNPLGNMNSSVALLERAPEDVNLVLNCTQIMKRQIGKIARLVDDLFDISSINQGKMALQREAVSVNHLMKVAVEDSSCEMESKNHSFALSLLLNDVKVNVDVTRLIQVFCNLLSNAAKYTNEGGSIRFSARCDGDQVTFVVEDNGIGLSPDSLSTIFNLYSQELRVAGKMGLGLGLALVKKLVELHQGDVWAESEGHDQGTKFYVSLPIYQEPELLQEDSQDPKRILLVEDNKPAAQALKMIIEMEGNHEVKLAHRGDDAIRQAMDFKPDLMLLDLGLPDMGGEVVGQVVRKHLPETCIVALTGYSQSETDGDWYDHFVTKPIDFSLLDRILNNCRPAFV